MKEIPLSRGVFAIVDDEDYEYLIQWRWYATKCRKTFYAMRNDGKYPNRKTIRMHRAITGVEPSLEVDHIDGNGLNNQKSNLRTCTKKENIRSRGMMTRNTSGYRGAGKYSSKEYNSKKYVAQICVDRKKITLGYFDDIISAAKAYDKAAKEYFGEFAKLNFPEETS